MPTRVPAWVPTLVLGAVVLAAAGCGQKGPLVPAVKAAPPAASGAAR